MADHRRFLYAPGVQEASFFLDPLRSSPRHRADFVERVPGVATTPDKQETLARLQPHHEEAAKRLGFSEIHYAEQIHGKAVALVTANSPLITPGADALISRDPVLLGIHVADCGALYLLDQATGAIGLVHSGKKGTELDITTATIETMRDRFGTRPADLIAVLGPCIRPPHYEVDFAHYHDCGLCTAFHPERFYSYRREKGNTGRLLALFGILPS